MDGKNNYLLIIPSFSNFSSHSILLKNNLWPTSEHFFQAQKFTDTPIEDQILKAYSPGKAAAMGRDRKNPLRKDWEKVKDDIMRQVVLAKFSQNEDIKKILLDTRNTVIIEHTYKDKYWADGGDGSGKNMLGKILMETREILLKEKKETKEIKGEKETVKRELEENKEENDKKKMKSI